MKVGVINWFVKDLIIYVIIFSVFMVKGKIVIGVRGCGYFKIWGKFFFFDLNNVKVSWES